MAIYEIREEGVTFARIEAESGDDALCIAESEYPRRSVDYNDYVGPITWRAWNADEGLPMASRVVRVS